MNPRLGFLLTLLVFVAGTGAGYLALEGRPSADQAPAKPAWKDIMASRNLTVCDLATQAPRYTGGDNSGHILFATPLADASGNFTDWKWDREYNFWQNMETDPTAPVSLTIEPQVVDLGAPIKVTGGTSNPSVEGITLKGWDVLADPQSGKFRGDYHFIQNFSIWRDHFPDFEVTTNDPLDLKWENKPTAWYESQAIERTTAWQPILIEYLQHTSGDPNYHNEDARRIAGQKGFIVTDRATTVQAQIPELKQIGQTLRRFKKSYTTYLPLDVKLTDLPAGATDSAVDVKLELSGKAKTMWVANVTAGKPTRIYFQDVFSPDTGRELLTFNSFAPALCRKHAPLQINVEYLETTVKQEIDMSGLPPMPGKIVSKLTAKVTDPDGHPVQGIAVNWQAYSDEGPTDQVEKKTDTTDSQGNAYAWVRWVPPAKDDPAAIPPPGVGIDYRVDQIAEEPYSGDTAYDFIRLSEQLPEPELSCKQTIPAEGWDATDSAGGTASEVPAPIVKDYTAGQDAKIAQPFHGTLDCTVIQKNPTSQPVTMELRLPVSSQFDIAATDGGTRQPDGTVRWSVTIQAKGEARKQLTGMKWRSDNGIVNPTSQLPDSSPPPA